jgi:DNA invertase Pin-like site-specific DNA recombinase
VVLTEAHSHPWWEVQRLLTMAGKWKRSGRATHVTPAPPIRVFRQLRTHEIDELVATYETGATTRELARHSGINRTTVGKHLQRRGVETRRPVQQAAAWHAPVSTCGGWCTPASNL